MSQQNSWVAVVGPFLFPWGQPGSRRVCGIARSLADAGYRVIVGENPLVREMFRTFEMLNGGAGFRYRYVSSMEEARDFLSRQPPRLRTPNAL